MDSAFDYVHDNFLTTEDAYPYTGKDGTCEEQVSGLKIGSHVDVAANSVAGLLAAVSVQPVSVAIEADRMVF